MDSEPSSRSAVDDQRIHHRGAEGAETDERERVRISLRNPFPVTPLSTQATPPDQVSFFSGTLCALCASVVKKTERIGVFGLRPTGCSVSSVLSVVKIPRAIGAARLLLPLWGALFLVLAFGACDEHSAGGGAGGAGGSSVGGRGGEIIDGPAGGAGGEGSGGTLAGAGEVAAEVASGDGGPADSGAMPIDVGSALDASPVGDADGEVPAIDTEKPSGPPDYLMVAADELAASAQRYRDFRRAGGFGVDLVMAGDVAGDASDVSTASARIRDFIRARYQAHDSNHVFYLLLLGDAQTTWGKDHVGVPAGTWMDPSTSASVDSDNVYADVDGDDVPDFAVGRITADSDAELDLVRAKVAAYETTHEIGVWDRRLSIFASTSGMGSLVDTAIETVVYTITEAIPYDFDETMTYARQSSPYVYIPEQFSDQVYRRINEGSLLVAYVGHGSTDGFASLDWNGNSFPILDTGHLENLAVTHKSPVLLFVACSTGAFVGSECVSERILAAANAPTAIFSSTEVSDPYANAIFVYEAAQAFTAVRATTVGDAFLLAKQRMMSNDDSVRVTIDALGALLESASARAALKRSHLHMYTLFGDPGMAMVYPGKAQVAVDPMAAAGGTDLTVSATFPTLATDGEAIVTLESIRKTILNPISAVPADGDASRDTVIAKNYQTANDKVVVGLTLPVSGSSLSTTVKVPAGLPAGQYHVKVFAQDGTADYAGQAALVVR